MYFDDRAEEFSIGQTIFAIFAYGQEWEPHTCILEYGYFGCYLAHTPRIRAHGCISYIISTA